MQLSFDQIRHYFEHRHPGQHIPAREKAAVRCAFHDEATPSCTLFLDGNGGFNCHACGAKGNVFQFEARFSHCSLEQAETNVAEITGAAPVARREGEMQLGPPVAIYDYRDENGLALFQKRRYQPEIGEKTFRVFRLVDGAWKPGIDAKEGERTRRVLYNLPHLVKANIVFFCYAPDTEVLTPSGWIPLPQLTVQHTIAQYTREDESIQWVHPSAVQKFDFDGNLVNFHGRWCDLLVTPEHRTLIRRKKDQKSYSDPVVVAADDVRSCWQLPTSGISTGENADVPTIAEARLLVSIQADGIYPRGYQLTWNLKKERKKKHLRSLLMACKLSWREMEFKSTPGWTLFILENRQKLRMLRFLPDKKFSWEMLNWPVSVRTAVLDELRYWDGDGIGSNGLRYFTADENNAQIISACCAITGHSCVMTVRERQRQNSHTEYILNLQPKMWRQCIGVKGKAYTSKPYAGEVYCCTVPSGFIVVRRNGKSMVCGQCEGEKDADNLLEADLFAKHAFSIATTTTYDGAWQKGHSPKWLDSYAPYFTGKQVMIFADHDEPGQIYAETVAASVAPFAYAVRVISFPEMPEKSDVSDFLKEHTVAELEKRIVESPLWVGTDAKRENWLVDAVEWSMTADAEIEWLVDGVIQVGGNGMIAAEPKTGKSLASLDLLLSLATGKPWLGCKIPRRIRTAYISREDSPMLTKVRMQALLRGKGIDPGEDPTGWLWVNTREQLGDFDVDNDDQLTHMAEDLKERGVEFAIFDVLNRLHNRDENNNTEMAQVVKKIGQMGQQAGCAIGVIHHVSKEAGNGRFFTRIRGATSIHGWTEWSIGFSIEDAGEKKMIRRAEFETKAAESREPISFTIQHGGGNLALVPLERGPIPFDPNVHASIERYD
jgi:hypothetical protein